MTVTISAYATVGVNEQGAPSEGAASFSLAPNLTPIYFPAGSGSGQASVIYVAHRSVALSSTDTLVLSSGLTDALGNAVAFTGVKGILIVADAANPADLVVGDAASHPVALFLSSATATFHVPPGGIAMAVNPGAGWTVSSGSVDQLAVANSSGSGSAGYEIVIWG